MLNFLTGLYAGGALCAIASHVVVLNQSRMSRTYGRVLGALVLGALVWPALLGWAVWSAMPRRGRR